MAKKPTNIWGDEIEDPRFKHSNKTHFNYNPKHFNFFGENKIALSREAIQHPQLMDILAKYTPDEFELQLAEIAAYCEIVLDDIYVASDLEHLCGILTKRLITKRVGIIFALPDSKVIE